jgi:hypothetical protein
MGPSVSHLSKHPNRAGCPCGPSKKGRARNASARGPVPGLKGARTCALSLCQPGEAEDEGCAKLTGAPGEEADSRSTIRLGRTPGGTSNASLTLI